MTKTVSLPEMIYAELVTVSGELTAITRKPVSLGMADYLLTSFYRGMMQSTKVRKSYVRFLEKMPLGSPEEFEETWNKYWTEVLKGED